MITASASPGREEQRHYSPSKSTVLKHDSCLRQLRDQSPRPTVQPVVSYGSHGAVITTGGPLRQPDHELGLRKPSGTAVSPKHSPTAAAAAAAATMSIGTAHEVHNEHSDELQKVSSPTAAGTGKRGQLESKPSITGSSMGTKRQVLLDHSATASDSGDSPKQHSNSLLPQPQQQQQQQQQDVAPEHDSDAHMEDPVHDDQQYEDNAENVAPVRPLPSLISPFGTAVPPALQGSTGSPDREKPPPAAAVQQQQQIQQQGSGGRPPMQCAAAAAAAGQMLPPSSSGSFRRPASGSPALQRAGSASLAAAAAAAAVDPAQKQPSEQRASLDSSGPSISVSNGIITLNPAISNAASLEGWLPAGAIAAAVAAAAEQQQSGSPRTAAAAAAAAAAALMRSSSTASSASIGRQGSLVFNPLAGLPTSQAAAAAAASNLGRESTATLESQGSFAGWPAAAAAAGDSTTAAANNAADSGFSWPKMPIARTLSEQQEALRRADSLALDIQVLAPVIPEEYPEQDPEDLEQQQYNAYQQQQQQLLQQQQQQQHVDKAFFAKISAWESELVGMLEQQQAPLAIREIVAVFKDRINTERDKAEFKALCDKWTGVVEYPVGSGIKCLAIKTWMRDGAAAVAAAGGHGSSRGVAAEPGGDYYDDVENRQPPI